jgi:hypothetical protein
MNSIGRDRRINGRDDSHGRNQDCGVRLYANHPIRGGVDVVEGTLGGLPA